MPDFDPTDTSNRAGLSNRDVAMRFVELFHRQNRVGEAFDCWVHPDYIQHNPNAPTGRDATKAKLVAAMEKWPELSHDVKQVIWGGEDLVAVHHHFRRQPQDRGYSVVDIVRIKDGYVVEHWDVMQEVPDPATAKNDNGMF